MSIPVIVMSRASGARASCNEITFTDSSDNSDHRGASDAVSTHATVNTSLLSIPQRRRKTEGGRPKNFLYLQARYLDSHDSPTLEVKTSISPTNSTKKKPRRIKRTNAFYLNRALQNEHDESFRTSASDESRGSITNSLGSNYGTTIGSCESLDYRIRRQQKMSYIIASKSDHMLLNLKRKIKKRTPKYQGSIDTLQLTNTDHDQPATARLLKSKVNHQSFDYRHKNYMVCMGCSLPVLEGSLAIRTADLPPKQVWHTGCFKCGECESRMMDLTYHPYDGKRYCAAHKPLLVKTCSVCYQEITDATFTKANGRYYHTDHFQCWRCTSVLSGNRFYGCGLYPICVPCYNDHLAKPCRACKGPINVDSQFYSLGRKRWHATPQCFNCTSCAASLVGKRLIASKGDLYCNKQCFNRLSHRSRLSS